MNIKMAITAGVLVSALAAAEANAADCSLSAPSIVPRGDFFAFTVKIFDFGPLDPFAAFTVVFYGAKDGVVDIPSGWQYPATLGYDVNVLTGFQNLPSGATTGNYIRWAVITDRLGNLACVTNAVNVTLQ
jgi:hypothetical protein